MQSWKAEVEMSSQQKEDQHACRVTRKKINLSRVIRKKLPLRKLWGMSQIAVFFQWFVVPDVRNRLAKAAGCGGSCSADRLKMARRCGAKHICKSKCTKHQNLAAILEVLIRKKWYATVARSTLASQNVQNTSMRERFSQFGSGKMVRHCGAKRICKSKCAKHHALGPIFALPIWKNGTPLRREAHLQVKMHKTPHARATFWSSDVEKLVS